MDTHSIAVQALTVAEIRAQLRAARKDLGRSQAHRQMAKRAVRDAENAIGREGMAEYFEARVAEARHHMQYI